ncbi:hypothetical protein CC80DRAFT_536957 [Byssothecium circinans]|uniref:Zn(2)-C6 fungal-type domain-containing protein n=1 Tax=Byssothecium circinans TaxID=147558 RepID=A0A6A5TYQ0_9PLEO|nr:hypothetical protein CC80DRAFT_536957 [Byssothecium circinans]
MTGPPNPSSNRAIDIVMANNFRALQPAPMEAQPSPQPPGRPLLTQKPKRTVTLGACVACRKRKSKCDGFRPICTCCSQKDTDCVYELGPNEKPSQAMKRKNEEMQGELSNLRQLYEYLRQRPEQEAQEILRRIRADPSEKTHAQRIQELAEFTRHKKSPAQFPSTTGSSASRQPGVSPNTLTLPPLRLALGSPSSDPNNAHFPGILSLGSEGPTTQRRRHVSDMDVSARSDTQNSFGIVTTVPYHSLLEQPIDPRLAATSNWTSVTDDKHLLSLLMLAWYKWEYSYYHFLDWDLFLDGLLDGKNGFCSELLVNAILATASFQLHLVNDRSKPFSDNIMTRFYQEAQRLWEKDEGHDSLPRLQGALCLYMVLGKHGRDKVGNMFLSEACRIARDMGLFRVLPHYPENHHVSIKNLEKARAVTAWALFNFQLAMSFTYSFPAIISSQPPVAIPYEDTPEKEALFRSQCARNIIILECSNTLIDRHDPNFDIPPKPEQIEILHLKLKTWYTTQAPSLHPENFPSPENLLAAMMHHIALIRLFQPFLNCESTIDRIQAYRDQASSNTSIAVRELRRLIYLQDLRHGWTNTIPLVLEPLVIASFCSLEGAALHGHSHIAGDTNESYQGLLICLRAVCTIGTYVFYAQVLFRLLTQSCQKLHIPLPPDIANELHLYQSEEWTNNAASTVSSQYIADLRKTMSGAENARMDAIVKQWKAMSLKEVKKEGNADRKE